MALEQERRGDLNTALISARGCSNLSLEVGTEVGTLRKVVNTEIPCSVILHRDLLVGMSFQPLVVSLEIIEGSRILCTAVAAAVALRSCPSWGGGGLLSRSTGRGWKRLERETRCKL